MATVNSVTINKRKSFDRYEVFAGDIVEWETRHGIKRGRISRFVDRHKMNAYSFFVQVLEDDIPTGREYAIGPFAIVSVCDKDGQPKQPLTR